MKIEFETARKQRVKKDPEVDPHTLEPVYASDCGTSVRTVGVKRQPGQPFTHLGKKVSLAQKGKKKPRIIVCVNDVPEGSLATAMKKYGLWTPGTWAAARRILIQRGTFIINAIEDDHTVRYRFNLISDNWNQLSFPTDLEPKLEFEES